MKEHETGTGDQNGALGEMKQKESDPVPDTPVDGDPVRIPAPSPGSTASEASPDSPAEGSPGSKK